MNFPFISLVKWTEFPGPVRPYFWCHSLIHTEVLTGEIQFIRIRFRHCHGKNRESRNKQCMTPCVRTRIRQRIRIRKRLFWSDHVAIYVVPCRSTVERVSFASLPVSFLGILSCRWKSTCDPAMFEISKITKDEAEQLIAPVRENVALYDQSSADYSTFSSFKQTSNNGFEWTSAINDAGKNGREYTAGPLYA